MGWVDPRVGLGRVELGRVELGRLGRDFAVFDGLGWVEYEKSTIFFDDYTTYICIAVELLGSSGKVYILSAQCAAVYFLLYGCENCVYMFKYD